MSLEQTRPEKAQAMTETVYAIREVVAARARTGELNIAEAINAMAQALASVLVGAYDSKNREVVVSTFPDVVRAYYPQWEKIYSAFGHEPSENLQTSQPPQTTRQSRGN